MTTGSTHDNRMQGKRVNRKRALEPGADRIAARRSAAAPKQAAQRDFPGTISAEQLLSLRRSIVNELAQRREDYRDMLVALDHALRDGQNGGGEDAADIGTRAFENDQARHLTADRLERIARLERALERIDHGTYGWCEGCQIAIPAARLEAYPAADLCVGCKSLTT